MDSIDPSLLLIFATFLLAGLVKGVLGFGLPTVSLALLAIAFDLPTAMALMLVPSLLTNLWQACAGGQLRATIQRTWPFLLAATATVWIGALALRQVDLAWLSGLLGLLLIVHAAIGLAGFGLVITGRHRSWAGPLFGAANGVLTGMTGSFVVPGVIYLQAIGLGRDALIQAMGLLFCASTLALALALQRNDLLGAALASNSTLALIPAMIGMVLGQRLRSRLPEALFRRLFLYALLVLGGYIGATALHFPN